MIDGQTYDAEEYLEDLLDLVDQLEGAELPMVLKDCGCN